MPPAPQRFLQDPEWYKMEELILSHIKPLLDITTIDTNQPAEHVKAEIIGRNLHYNALAAFLRSSGIIRENKLSENKENIFK